MHLLATDDNGRTWENVADVSACVNDFINESSLCVYNGKLYIAIRPTKQEYMILAVLDSDFRLVHLRRLCTEEGISEIGRPKLFLRDGKMYMIIRNRIKEGRIMRLDLIRLNTETLLPEKITVIDDEYTKDGQYAEPYFDGEDICIITYRCNDGGATPDITHFRCRWDDVK